MANIETTRKNSRDRLWQALQALGPLLALLMVTLGFALADQVWGQGRFSELRNFRVVLVQAAPVAVAALGMTLIIISGGIDLSAGTASMLCATVLAAMLSNDYSITLAVSYALLTGAACGLVNGLLIGLLRIAPFIVTLGTMTIFLGVAKRVAGGSTVFVDRHDADHGLGLMVASEQHRSGPHPLGRVGVGHGRPAEAVVILTIQVGYEIKVVHGAPARSGQHSRYEFNPARPCRAWP